MDCEVFTGPIAEAFTKGVFVDFRDTGWDRYAAKARTAGEGLAFDLRNTLRDYHTGERWTIPKGAAGDSAVNIPRDRHTSQFVAMRKRLIANSFDALRNRHTGQP